MTNINSFDKFDNFPNNFEAKTRIRWLIFLVFWGYFAIFLAVPTTPHEDLHIFKVLTSWNWRITSNSSTVVAECRCESIPRLAHWIILAVLCPHQFSACANCVENNFVRDFDLVQIDLLALLNTEHCQPVYQCANLHDNFKYLP